MGLPPFEGSIAAQFPDTSLADIEQTYQTFNMVRCALARPCQYLWVYVLPTADLAGGDNTTAQPRLTGALHHVRLMLADGAVQHGCTFYIAVEGDMLRLDDMHVEDHNTREWQRPQSRGDLPTQAAMYQQVHCCCVPNGSEGAHPLRWLPDAQLSVTSF